MPLRGVGAGETATIVDHVRLFRNDPRIRWTYRVHEQILPALRAVNAEVVWSDVVILHTGYTDETLRKKKLERDLRLLRLQEREMPDEAFTLFNLGCVLRELSPAGGGLCRCCNAVWSDRIRPIQLSASCTR